MIKTNFKQICFVFLMSLVAMFVYTNVVEAVHIHTYSAATCTTPKKCTGCGATSGSALGHNYQVTSSTSATCTSGGKTVSKCSRCSKTQTSTTDALGHSYSTTKVAATCTTAGKIVKTCSRCNDTQTTSLSALGHDYHTTQNVSATCTSSGRVVKTCSRCNKTQTTTTEALGHKYVTTTNISATCTTKGKIVKTCSRCNDEQRSETPALGHDYETIRVEATCTTGGNLTEICSRCGDYHTTTIGPLGHKYVTVTSTATCTLAGKTVKKCSVCGDEITIEGEPLGHDYKETSRVEPTCTKTGKIINTCSRCGNEETIEIPKIGHQECIVFNETHHWYECEICNQEITEHEEHDFDDDNVCRVCGYHKGDDTDNPEEPDDPSNPDGDLIIEPWMKENDELNCLAVSLRSEPYDVENRANKNIYALDEKVVYYVDYKNGGKDIEKDVKLQLTLPLAFSVVNADGATVSKSKKTFTWTFDRLEKGDCGTKVVVIRYTSLGSSTATYKTITPKATISVDGKQKDVSAVINLIVKDLDIEIKDTHYPYMYGDEDTGTFRPDATIKRGEGALVFTRIFGISTKYDENTYAFPDLNETYLEARRAVMAATAYGIIEGYPDGTYKPNKPMTRGEFITILARQIEEEYGEGFEVKDEDQLIKVYKDRNRIYYISDNEYYDAHWSVSYATLLARLNMTPLSEDDTNLRVDDPITRAEVAQLVNFYLLRAPAKVTASTKTQFPDVSRRHELFADIVEATREAHNYSITDEAEEVAE